MVYKFRSRASGDVIMLGPVGDAVMGILGRAPSERGIIEPAAMPVALAALRAATDAAPPPAAGETPGSDDDGKAAEAVSMKARLWPMIDLLERSMAAGEPITWGV